MSTTAYAKSPRFFDLVDAAAGHDVARESAAIVAAIRAVAPEARTLLDAACGTGAHLAALAREFAVSGYERELVPLQIARSRDGLGAVDFGSIETLAARPAADVVIALRGSIAAARSKERLNESVARLAAARAPGGIVLVEPFASPDEYVTGAIEAIHVDEPREKISRVIVTRRGAHIAILDYQYLIASPAGVERVFERIERGLYAPADYVRAFERAGMTCERLESDAFARGLYRGR